MSGQIKAMTVNMLQDVLYLEVNGTLSSWDMHYFSVNITTPGRKKPSHDVAVQMENKETKEQATQAGDPASCNKADTPATEAVHAQQPHSSLAWPEAKGLGPASEGSGPGETTGWAMSPQKPHIGLSSAQKPGLLAWATAYQCKKDIAHRVKPYMKLQEVTEGTKESGLMKN
ncbi:hypothetical protein F5141DRAFT_1061738 [Pisolithus sp. B1]|nr:hypothetical protein F5141DRAFT_1061738 [Pisolithus sp. B1]